MLLIFGVFLYMVMLWLNLVNILVDDRLVNLVLMILIFMLVFFV